MQSNTTTSNIKKITITAYQQRFEGKQHHVFQIKDNGIGIQPKFHESVFRIFKRLHKKGAYGGGTGSGLTFVKKIIDRHGGRIWIESEPGQGSSFFFTIPHKSEIEPAPPPDERVA